MRVIREAHLCGTGKGIPEQDREGNRDSWAQSAGSGRLRAVSQCPPHRQCTCKAMGDKTSFLVLGDTAKVITSATTVFSRRKFLLQPRSHGEHKYCLFHFRNRFPLESRCGVFCRVEIKAISDTLAKKKSIYAYNISIKKVSPTCW